MTLRGGLLRLTLDQKRGAVVSAHGRLGAPGVFAGSPRPWSGRLDVDAPRNLPAGRMNGWPVARETRGCGIEGERPELVRCSTR